MASGTIAGFFLVTAMVFRSFVIVVMVFSSFHHAAGAFAQTASDALSVRIRLFVNMFHVILQESQAGGNRSQPLIWRARKHHEGTPLHNCSQHGNLDCASFDDLTAEGIQIVNSPQTLSIMAHHPGSYLCKIAHFTEK